MDLIVIVATIGRETLFTRCLPSILSQERQPEKVLIIIDGTTTPPPPQSLSKAIQNFFSASPLSNSLEILRNCRTAGASGTWNSGLLSLVSQCKLFERKYLAFLDDDDHWATTHLSSIAKTILETKYPPLIYTGIVRVERNEKEEKPKIRQETTVQWSAIESSKDIYHKIVPPSDLRVEDFLVGNPHIQGSNLVCRFDALLKVGLFDESLLSCTDRDLLIRFIDTGFGPFFQTTNQYTSFHHRERYFAQLSDFGSPSKLSGLTFFYRKYLPRMDAKMQHRYFLRSQRLFGWSPPSSISPTSNIESPSDSPTLLPLSTSSLIGHVWLNVGICSDSNSNRIKGILEDLSSLIEKKGNGLQQGTREEGETFLDIVVLENGPINEPRSSPLRETIQWARQTLQLRITLIEPERVKSDWNRGAFPMFNIQDLPTPHSRAPIAVTRTLIQHYLFSFSKTIAEACGKQAPSIATIVFDDDKRIPDPPIFRSYLRQLSINPRSDVIVLPDKGAPPLPILFSLRTQLLDFTHNLHSWLVFAHHHTMETHLPLSLCLGMTESNSEFLETCPELYHDLSFSHFNHLERPYWPDFKSPSKLTTPLALIENLVDCTESLFRGEPIFRTAAPSQSGVHLDRRGGACLITDPTLLTVPNLVPNFDGIRCRRSDFLWTWVCRVQKGALKTQPLSPFVYHSREEGVAVRMTRDQLARQAIADILGSSVYRACAGGEKLSDLEVLQEGKEDFDDEGNAFIGHCTKRSVQLLASIYRIEGLITSLHQLVVKFDDFFTATQRETLNKVVESLGNICDSKWWTSFMRDFLDQLPHHKSTFCVWRVNLPALLTLSQQSCHLFVKMTKDLWIKHRIVSATEKVQSFLQCSSNEYELIGVGCEGISFLHFSTQMVYKYLDLFSLRCSWKQRVFLFRFLQKRRKSSFFSSTLSLPLSPDSIHYCFIIRPFVHGKPYEISSSTQSSDRFKCWIVQFVLDCRKLGVVFSNVKPDNLVGGESTFQFVDFGLDIFPWTREHEMKMCLRLFLTWKWGRRPDLPAMMKRVTVDFIVDSALRSVSQAESLIPELFGFSSLWHAIQLSDG